MGNVLVIFKIFSDPENVETVEKELSNIKSGKVREVKKEPLGFGIDIIKAGYIIPDKTEGAMEALEEEIRKIDGINQLEVEGITLL